MTRLWTWSSSASTDPDLFTGTAPSIDSAGLYGERYLWPSTTAVAWMRKTVALPSDFRTRFIYSLASYSSLSHAVFAANDSGSSFQMRVDLSGGGLLRLRADSASGSTQVAQGTVAIPTNQELRFEVQRAGTTGTVKVYRANDNTLLDTISGTIGGGAVDRVTYGSSATITGTLGAFSFDEIVIDDVAGEVGPVPSALAATATLTPPSVGQGGTLTLVITATGGTGTYSYSVTDWGDGSSSPAQNSNTFTKVISATATLGSKTVKWSVTG